MTASINHNRPSTEKERAESCMFWADDYFENIGKQNDAAFNASEFYAKASAHYVLAGMFEEAKIAADRMKIADSLN